MRTLAWGALHFTWIVCALVALPFLLVAATAVDLQYRLDGWRSN